VKRTTRNVSLLAVAALALVALVLWLGRRDYVRDPPALTSLDPDAVTRIELVIAQGQPQVFRKRADGWWRIAPGNARAIDRRLQRLANLAATPVARWLPPTGVDAAKLGLANPSATLSLDGVTLRYGGLSALDDQRYVAVRGRIALVPRQYSPEVMLAKGGNE
jgi:hypothetical protein